MSSQKRTLQFFAAFGSVKCHGAGMREHVAKFGVVDVMRITLAAAIGCY
jgi:hypothetical protein